MNKIYKMKIDEEKKEKERDGKTKYPLLYTFLGEM